MKQNQQKQSSQGQQPQQIPPEFNIFQQMSERKQEKLALMQIEKRAQKKDRQMRESFMTSDINPMNSFFLRHIKALSYCSLECFHATFFHIIDTVKVRGMARNLKTGDTSYYFKNNVMYKLSVIFCIIALISGVISGFLGSAAGSLTFISTFNSLTYYFYTQPKYSDWDFRLKNFCIYLISDFTSSFARIFFETRKQLIQMCNYQSPIGQIMKATYLGWFPLMLRDIGFRAILLGFYYGTTHIEHKPTLKYTVPQIADIMRQRRTEGHQETVNDLKQHFYEFHNYDIKTKITTRYALLILANVVATVLTNPIDVCLTKILTQQEPKYKGFFHCLKTVYKEEGAYKFLSGVHPRFMFNFFNGALFLFVYDRFMEKFRNLNE